MPEHEQEDTGPDTGDQLRPPDEEQRPPGRGGLLFLLLVFFGLFILIDIAILAYWLLPGREESKTSPARPEKTTEQPSHPGAAARQHKEPLDAAGPARPVVDTARAFWLQARAVAEAENVAAWGAAEYERIGRLAEQGDAAMLARDYAAAGKNYRSAGKELESLLAGRPQLFASAMRQGQEALGHEQAETARKAFTTALAISPEDEKARHGLTRAENLDQVLAMFRQGTGLEKKGQLVDALAAYRGAAELDPEFSAASLAGDRVEKQVRDLRYRQAMGRFLASLDQGRLHDAEAALKKAATLHPQDQAVKDGRKALKQARDARLLARLQKKYQQLARTEQWQQAMEVCKQALAVSPQSFFAVSGLRTAGERLALERALDSILARPGRLQEDAPLAEARETLALARTIDEPDPRLRIRISKLEKLLSRAAARVSVTLRSDGATSVVIYRVGRLGRFQEKTVQLRPGRYVVVGTRPGFRDVRYTLQVDAEHVTTSLQIRCEEPI